ncbi:unnamed protein product [Protopolystoma xenopodis]|uniref:Uncharacterized protein n=1 Tax=Protopolystoma xenopodis TaxID=117903 RepID=A0A448WWK4_9PLAT|nr:unnamed protein product [Protopolystoma xenopodis]
MQLNIPCYSAVEPLQDREDRDAALVRITSLTKQLSHTSQATSRLVGEALTCLSSLVAKGPNDTGSIDIATTLKRNQHYQHNLSGSSFLNLTGGGNNNIQFSPSSVNADFTPLAGCLCEARAVALDSAGLARRLWATRQAVALYDAGQTRGDNRQRLPSPQGAGSSGDGGRKRRTAPNHWDQDEERLFGRID